MEMKREICSATSRANRAVKIVMSSEAVFKDTVSHEK